LLPGGLEAYFRPKKFLFMKTKNIIQIATLMSMLTFSGLAQQSKETVTELSKKAQKGYFYGLETGEDLKLLYKIPGDKNKNEISYEQYQFDKNLTFKGAQPTSENKTGNADYTLTCISATVGGGNSFNVLSMKLSLSKSVWERKWDFERQKYIWGKRLSSEVVKPKNGNDKYKGFAAYENDSTGELMVVASYDSDKKDVDNQFVILYVSTDLDVKETQVPLTGKYSLVYTGQLENGNVFIVLAPKKGATDIKKYMYVEYSNKGALLYKTEFASPSANMIVMDAAEASGSLYLIGMSTKGKGAYNEVFTDYAPINNPSYTDAANFQQFKYEKQAYAGEAAFFHLVKIEKGKVAFINSTPVEQFKALVKTPPSQKKSTPYKGKRLSIQQFYITPSGDYLVAGQLKNKKISQNSVTYLYQDIICLHFDSKGQLLAQYAVEKINNDSKSEMFQTRQHFYPSKDGKSVYWELLEVKGSKGYESFLDAYNNNPTFHANFFPRIAKISTNPTSLSNFTVLGKGDFLIYKNHSAVFDEKENSKIYFGHDEGWKKLWLGKYVFE
jgi:hypothetical protein